MLSTHTRQLIGASASALLFAIFAVILSQAAEAVTVHMSPAGDDANDGSEARPVLSINRAQEIISAALKAEGEHRILVHPGEYRGQSVVWTATSPTAHIEISSSDARAAIFDGDRKGLTFFRLKTGTGGPTNISIKGLTIQYYATAISLDGDRSDLSKFNGGNRIEGNAFNSVGGEGFSKLGYSTAVVRVQNSRDNKIIGNTFSNIIGLRCQHLHAIYLAHGSSNNEIYNNIFEKGCGDAIRARDQSNYNLVVKNKFVDIGVKAALSEWFCSGRKGCTLDRSECPSTGNVMKENILDKDYNGRELSLVFTHPRPIPAACMR